MYYSFEALSVLAKAGLVDLKREIEQKAGVVRADGRKLFLDHNYGRPERSPDLLQQEQRPRTETPRKVKERRRKQQVLKSCVLRLRSQMATSMNLCCRTMYARPFVEDPERPATRPADENCSEGSEYLKYLYYSYKKAKAGANKHLAILRNFDEARTQIRWEEHRSPAASLGKDQRALPISASASEPTMLIRVKKPLSRYSTATGERRKLSSQENAKQILQKNQLFLRRIQSDKPDPGSGVNTEVRTATKGGSRRKKIAPVTPFAWSASGSLLPQSTRAIRGTPLFASVGTSSDEKEGMKMLTHGKVTLHVRPPRRVVS